MSIKGSHIKNAVLLVLLAFLFFTPPGKTLRVRFMRLLIMAPKIKDKPDYKALLGLGNWVLKDLKGNRYDFSSWKGQVIFLNFWASWCPPCRVEMPSIQRLYERFGDRVVFLLVSAEKCTAIEAYLDERTYDFPVYQSLTSPPAALQTHSLPFTVVIDRRGRLVLQETGASDWDAKAVHQLLEKLIAKQLAKPKN